MKLNNAIMLLVVLVLLAGPSFAQSVTGYEKVYYTNPEMVSPDGDQDISFEFKNAVAQFDHCKFGIKIVNNTSDYLVFDSQKSSFSYPFGDKHPTVKPIMIKPNKAKTKTLLVKGGEDFLQKSFDFNLLGAIWKIPVNGDAVTADDFVLPAAKNSFTAGDFKVVLKKYSATTKEAKAIFECTYTGNKIGLINPSNLSVTAERKKSNETVTYANDDKKGETSIVRKGEKIKVTAVFHIPGKIVDMQFAQMNIIWNDTFVETTEIPIEGPQVHFEMNEALTQEKK